MMQTSTYKPNHILSKKSVRQNRNVFLWCSNLWELSMGWHVDKNLPITIATAYRWAHAATLLQYPAQRTFEPFLLFRVKVEPEDTLLYSIQQYGEALPWDSQEILEPGDYGLYGLDGKALYRSYKLQKTMSFYLESYMAAKYDTKIFSHTQLEPSLSQQALKRDRACVFTGDTDYVITNWVFPPFLGFLLETEPDLAEVDYYDHPELCDLTKFMNIKNIISGRSDVIELFWKSKLGIDVDDHHRIVVFEGQETLLQGRRPLEKFAIIDHNDPSRPSDEFLRLHLARCLTVSAGHGDIKDDFSKEEVEDFLEKLGDCDDDHKDEWSTPVGQIVLAFSKALEAEKNLTKT